MTENEIRCSKIIKMNEKEDVEVPSPIQTPSRPTLVPNLTRNPVQFLSMKDYVPPSWASHLNHIPTHLCSLGQFPTPIHRWNLPNLPNNTRMWIKREDLWGMEMSGNKVRKLEFLIAEALKQGADCIITTGYIQSNHCRATAVAAKYFNLQSHLILFTSQALLNQDPGFNGNLLIERLVGAHVYLASEQDRAKIGSHAFTDYLKSKLVAQGRKPYVIPVGGSNSLGNWGYIDAIREIEQQVDDNVKFDDIVVACGSGGTLDGLTLGSYLSTLKAKVHAFSIFEHRDNYFYDSIQQSLDRHHVNINSHDIVEVHKAEGLGYALNTTEELDFIRKVAESTGIILDPVYSGKAAYAMMKEMGKDPSKWEGRNILFIHTGGLFGMYDKLHDLQSITFEKCHCLNVHEVELQKCSKRPQVDKLPK